MADDPPVSMEKALDALGKDAQATLAKIFLTTRWNSLRTETDFANAYDGLRAAIKILGPMNPNYLATLKQLQRTLESYVKARTRMTPEEWLNISREHLEKLLALLQNHLSPEVWEKAGARITEMFDRIVNQGDRPERLR